MSLADGRFDLLETMAFDPEEGIRLLDLHLERLKTSATALGFAFDRHAVRNDLQAATFRLRERSRLRLLVSRGGATAIEVRAHRTWPHAVMPVAIVPRNAPASDLRLLHKTTDRSLYRDALRRALATLAMPVHAARAARLAWRAADVMWRAAGDTATDLNHYSKRMTLTAIYGATILAFIDDESEEQADSRAFLARRIEGLMRFEKMKARIKGAGGGERLSLSRFIGRLRYRAT